MTAATRYSQAARGDLLDIWLHIAADDVTAADNQLGRLEAAVTRLRDFPDIGHHREDAGRSLRVLLQDSFLIIYRHEPDAGVVTIERIVHGSRNLTAIFDA
ncbi:type II toxin-antitoxin system RelE/ParE family toxin [Erythrobacter donghaensis]|uniref:type II toxin-antitoxin system RelE/ParE family toxin n=1 Tax=Erythrobacter donghaensis TaxID=267135 RepID=UPI000A3C1F48|nr:type II toxin-antitoxin system RelE/ParE family toxin [Erythrobacter donghaensis]